MPDEKKEGLGLVLTMKEGDKCFIHVGGEIIEITAVKAKGHGQSRIAIKADKERVKIHRENWIP